MIVGAGLAGCWLSHELHQRGHTVRLLDKGAGPASGASGNAAGILKPFVTRQPSHPEAFYRAAFDHVLQRLGQHGLKDACRFRDRGGAVQLVRKPYEPREGLHTLDAAGANALSGLPLNAPVVHYPSAGWLNPGALCRALLRASPVQQRYDTDVTGLRCTADGWHLDLDDGSVLSATRLVLTTGHALAQFGFASALPITAARGQLSRFARGAIAGAGTVVTGSRWLIPDGDAIWTGATYDRDDTDARLRSADTQRNRDALEQLGGAAAGEVLEERAGIRATVPDRLPIVGPLAQGAGQPPGLAVLGGLGSRGIVTAALCASMLADWLDGDAAPLTRWYDLLRADRFKPR